MRYALSFILLLTAAGCAQMPSFQGAPPDADAFPNQELTYRVHGSVDATIQHIQDTLTRRNVRSTPPMKRSPSVFIISAYIYEPLTGAERRARRTAFRFTVIGMPESLSSSPCSTVAVASLTQSKGVFEEQWSIQESDKTFTSSAWPIMQQEFSTKECK